MKFLAILLTGSLAWFIGKALHVPVWTTWEVGDRVDITLYSMVLMWVLIRLIEKKSTAP